MWAQLTAMTAREILLALLDIAVVAYLFYRLLLIIRGTRAVQLLKGLLIVLLVIPVSGWIDLHTTHWLFSQAAVLMVVAIPIVFQPELRRALEQVGRGRLFASRSYLTGEEESVERVIDELITAVERLTRDRIGALIVIERETGLGEIEETGIQVDARLSAELVVNLFIPESPLHDGAIILRGARVTAAACYLPVTDSTSVPPTLGFRHRAALGMSEQSDALVLVVSEETADVSLARDGKLIRHLNSETLRELLEDLLEEKEEGPVFPLLGRGERA